jgi:ubiquinone/menaquinone biosynthesis C-methylase UbiE
MKYKSKDYALANIKDDLLAKRVLEHLNPKSTDNILEIGCGRGFLTKKTQEICLSAIGIDVNPETINNGVAKNLKVMDATKLDFPSDSFDKVYSCHTIEHVPDLKGFFKEAERVLKPGGKMILVYPFEIIRGISAIGSSLVIFKHPFCCRKIHIHNLNPKKVRDILKETKLKHVESKFYLLKTPHFLTVLEKSI